MFNVKNYKFSFDIWGMGLFLVIMVPNFIWFAYPAVNDVLRTESVTPIVDAVASVFQIIMAAALCVIKNREAQKPMWKGFFWSITILVLLYFFCWFFYYAGIVNVLIIFRLCIFPCLAFVIFSVSRKNAAALISAGVFMLCHVIFCVINLILKLPPFQKIR